jgi:hypothetical protein
MGMNVKGKGHKWACGRVNPSICVSQKYYTILCPFAQEACATAYANSVSVGHNSLLLVVGALRDDRFYLIIRQILVGMVLIRMLATLLEQFVIAGRFNLFPAARTCGNSHT